MATAYLPYAFVREAAIMGVYRWVVVNMGVYLALAMGLRSLLQWHRRLPAWGNGPG